MRKIKKRLLITILSGILCISGFFTTYALAGEEPEPIDGGSEVHIDTSAPKEINSEELIEFEAFFVLLTRWKTDEDDNQFLFVVTDDEDGQLIAMEKNLGIQHPADEELMSGLQEIIVKNNLVQWNGIYDVTAGLPPEYGPGGLHVVYASGETLDFTMDNNPYALWEEEVYDLFAEWFRKHGEDSLYPPKDDSIVTRLDLSITENGTTTDYFGIHVSEAKAIDGETFLLKKKVYNAEYYSDISDDLIKFPEDYYEQITRIIADTDLVMRYYFSIYSHASGLLDNHDQGYFGMGDASPDAEEEDSEEASLDLYITYENGSILNIETQKASEMEGMRPLINELTSYLDRLF